MQEINVNECLAFFGLGRVKLDLHNFHWACFDSCLFLEGFHQDMSLLLPPMWMQAIDLDQDTISTLRGPNLSNTWEVLIPISEQGFIVFSEPLENVSCQGHDSFFSQKLASNMLLRTIKSINSINQHNKEAQVQKVTIPDASPLRNHLHCIIRVSQLNCYNMGESSHLHMVPSLGPASEPDIFLLHSRLGIVSSSSYKGVC